MHPFRGAVIHVMLLALIASASCLATPVQTLKHSGSTIVRSGPITGGIVSTYDVVGGRFSLHVGPWRVKDGLTQKIPWWVRSDKRGPELVLTAVRLAPAPAETFRQVFPAATSPDDVYPSIIDPPSAGCWRLTMRTGSIKVVFVALVRP
jgi:hypothetical protein